MLHLLAIDAGGTSTRAMVLDASGRCLAIGRAGRGNPVSDGADKAAAAIAAAAADAVAAAGVRAREVTVGALALAGGTAMGGVAWVTPALVSRGLHVTLTHEQDLHAMFASGTPDEAGYALVAGTGATAVRVADSEVAATADGLGWLLGDTGSGFWIGQRVARAAAAALDGIGPSTSLVARVVDSVGLAATGGHAARRDPRLTALVSEVYAASPLRLAALAPLAFDDPDDAVSVAIVDEAVEALAALLSHLAVDGLSGPLVMGGGVATQPLVQQGVVRAVASAGITGPVALVQDGLVGAAVLALRRAGQVVDAPVFDRLSTSTAAARLTQSRSTSPAAPA